MSSLSTHNWNVNLRVLSNERIWLLCMCVHKQPFRRTLFIQLNQPRAMASGFIQRGVQHSALHIELLYAVGEEWWWKRSVAAAAATAENQSQYSGPYRESETSHSRIRIHSFRVHVHRTPHSHVEFQIKNKQTHNEAKKQQTTACLKRKRLCVCTR